jgi:hypothetical protein
MRALNGTSKGQRIAGQFLLVILSIVGGDPGATTLRKAALGMNGIEANLPDLPVTTDYQYAETIPVFFGHYWLQGTPAISSKAV